MSDTIEDFKAIKEQSKEDRRLRRELAQRILEADREITFSSYNSGSRLIVVGISASADFWPGTNLWHTRGRRVNFKGRGIETMLLYVKTGVFKR